MLEGPTVTVAPGGELRPGAAGWPDAPVTIERGEVELVCRGGTRARFAAGDMVWLTGFGLCAVRNPGVAPAVLVALRRRAPSRA